jgi:hypothetical protein
MGATMPFMAARGPTGSQVCSVNGLNRDTSAGGRSITWDAESRTPPPLAGTLDAHGLLTRLADTARNRAGRRPVGKAATAPVDG